MPKSSANILIVDDDVDVACAAELLLRRRHEKIRTVTDPGRLDAAIKEAPPDLVLLDLNFTPGRTDGGEGLALLDRLRGSANPPAVIILTAYADVPLAVEALKRGASDFITKPWDNARLTSTIDAILNRIATQQSPSGSDAASVLMGDSAAMRDLRAMVASVAPTEANIMVLGENGVGKELVARAIHAASRRATGGFLAIDMGALPESTFESELFGHRKGAFTDARSDRTGRFQAARGGTLFLDEIGNLPLAGQAKLLTALERREVTPVGADHPEAIDVRVVSATNMEEAKLFDPGTFRRDLLFRLNTIAIRVPPLRERASDIPSLLDHYLRHYQNQYKRPAVSASAAAIAALQEHSWPGNVRELRQACERAVILGQGTDYRFDDFGLCFDAPSSGNPAKAMASDVDAGEKTGDHKLDVLERDAVASALYQAEGNITRAAKLLGISRGALYRKLQKHDL